MSKLFENNFIRKYQIIKEGILNFAFLKRSIAQIQMQLVLCTVLSNLSFTVEV